MQSRFYFACCQFGAEKAVKAEVIAAHPQLKFAFSRPGFITFKDEFPDRPEIKKSPAVFVRHWGVSLAQAKDPAAAVAMLKELPEGAIVHTFERDTFVPGDDPPGFAQDARIEAALSATTQLAPELQKRFRFNTRPKPGDKVYDLIWLDDFHLFLGTHTHQVGIDPSPGNRPRIELPPTAPSRAYLKLAEAVERFGLEAKPGMQAVEVGCSPGGATSWMLSRQMQVVGIDPKAMSPMIDEYKTFRLIQKPGKAVTAQDLGQANPEWIVMDMNIAPHEALDELFHVVRMLRKNQGKKLAVRAGFITLKLNDWKFAQNIPQYLKRLEEIGFRKLTALQLSSNRQEFFVMARDFA